MNRQLLEQTYPVGVDVAHNHLERRFRGHQALEQLQVGAANDAPGGCTSTGGTDWPERVVPALNR